MNNAIALKNDAEKEGYEFFDQHIRVLPKDARGEIIQSGHVDNDVDAFRHAYVSGVLTMQLSANQAAFYGYLQELTGGNGSSASNSEAAKNMDFWNNAVGRKYGKKAKTRKALLNMIQKALKNGELIINLNDPRQYDGDIGFNSDPDKPVIVVSEGDTGRNELFVDTVSGVILDRASFLEKIESGEYPGYQVAKIDDLPTPMSKPDRSTENNLA